MSARNTPKIQSRLNKSALSLVSATKETPLRLHHQQPPTPAQRQQLPSASRSTATRSNVDLRQLEAESASLPHGISSCAKRSHSKLPLSLNTPSATPRNTSATSGAPTPKSSARRFGQSSLDARIGGGTPECFAKVSIETPTTTARRRPALARSNTADDIRMRSLSAAPPLVDANATAPAASSEISTLTVAVRVRPLNARELALPSVTNVISVRGNEVIARAGNTADSSASVSHRFQYDRAFWCCNEEHANFADQRQVFEGTALPLIDKAFEGYNACLFAYGQTGSGKSYSMMGVDADDNHIGSQSEAGIIPRFCQELFDRIEALKDTYRVDVEVSYFEIYNEKIHDLLAVTSGVAQLPSAKRTALRVREHPTWGPYVVDLSTHVVESHTDLRNWLAVGNSQRATAATGMNDQSSRSHSIFNIVLTLTDVRPPGKRTDAFDGSDEADAQQQRLLSRRSKISLVDLAGSERVNHTCAKGERMREGVSINKSLLTLGKVIAALADTKKSSAAFVPYRESVLTWLLRENLGGNSRTIMLATISPASLHLDETLATLRYACQARTIVNRVRVNEDPHGRRIRELHAEIERLQVQAQDYERQKRQSTTTLAPRKIIIETTTCADEAETQALRAQLSDVQEELMHLKQQQLNGGSGDAARRSVRTTDVKMLRWNGLALEFSAAQTEACLVNLVADPMRGGVLLYVLPLGVVRVGRARPAAFEQPDIVLDGATVAFSHCSIENLRGDLYIEPLTTKFDTLLNGDVITERTRLFNGDRVVLGESHFYRVSNPHCSHRHSEPIDFQPAYTEILRQQEQRLRAQADVERAAHERLYRERLAALQHAREIVECEKQALALERQQIAVPHGTDDQRRSGSSQQCAVLDMIRRFGTRPSDDLVRHIEAQLEVAQRRCGEFGLAGRFEFRQRQVPAGLGTYVAVVNIIDAQQGLVAEWPTVRLDVWLDRLPDSRTAANGGVTAENLFDGFDVVWRTAEEYDAGLQESSPAASTTASPRASLVGGALRGLRNVFGAQSPAKVKQEAALLKSALINQQQQQQQQQQTELTKKRLHYETTPAAQKRGHGVHQRRAENAQPSPKAGEDEGRIKEKTPVRSPKFVRMQIE